MDTQIVKIQTKGLVTIPKKFRDELGLEENGLARVRKEKGKLILEAVRTLPYSVRTYTKSEVEDFINEDKKEAKTLKNKGLI